MDDRLMTLCSPASTPALLGRQMNLAKSFITNESEFNGPRVWFYRHRPRRSSCYRAMGERFSATAHAAGPSATSRWTALGWSAGFDV